MRRQVLVLAWVGLLGAGGARATCQQVFFATSSGFAQAELLEVDPATGMTLASAPITNEIALRGGLSYDASTPTMWSIDFPGSTQTFMIDPMTGMGTIVGPINLSWNYMSVEDHPLTGVLYATGDNTLYSLNKTSGAATVVATISGTIDEVTALAINGRGAAYITDFDSGASTAELFKLDLTTGLATRVGDLGSAVTTAIQDLAFDGSGKLWGVKTGGGVYTINTASGMATLKFTSAAWGGITFKTGFPLCLKWCNFCDGIQVNAQGLNGAEWYKYDCINSSPLDDKVFSTPKVDNCPIQNPNTRAIFRSRVPNGPGDYYFILDFPLDGTIDMHMGTYPTGTCWIDELCYVAQIGRCHDLAPHANRSSIQ